MTYEQIRQDEAIKTYIRQADASLAALGYTEHSFAHVGRVAEIAGYVLETMGYPERTVELAKIAGYLHDIGNLVNRVEHSQSGAVMAFRLLDIEVLHVRHPDTAPPHIGLVRQNQRRRHRIHRHAGAFVMVSDSGHHGADLLRRETHLIQQPEGHHRAGLAVLHPVYKVADIM